MTIRLLAPAGPVFSGRLATVSVRFRAPEAGALATWRWEDGGHDQERVDPGSVVRARRTHRYDAPGVYRVRVQVGDGDEAEDRYVTVARADQVAASGWVRDVERGERIAFGFLITPGGDGAPEAINLRALLGGVELSTNHIAWLMTSHPGSLHFGGLASFGAAAPEHQVDSSVPALLPLGAEPGIRQLNARRGDKAKLSAGAWSADRSAPRAAKLHGRRADGPHQRQAHAGQNWRSQAVPEVAVSLCP